MYNFFRRIYSIYTNAIIMAIISCLFGAVLLFFPIGSMTVLSVAIGALLIFAGCTLMGNYFLNQATAGAISIFGIIPLIFGILLIANPAMFIDFVPTMFGIYVLFAGIDELSNASRARSLGYKVGLSYLLACSTIIVGLGCIIFSWFVAKLAIRIVGISIIYKGITRLIYDRNMRKKATKFYEEYNSDVIDGKFRN